MLDSTYDRKQYETQSLDATCEVCGGTREALAIRHTLFSRHCGRACETVSISLGLSTPYPQARHPHR